MNGNNIKNALETIVGIICYTALFTIFSSCTDNESDETDYSKKVYMSFVAGQSAITRTTLTDENSVEWEEGDNISLFDPVENNMFTTSQKGSSATFTGMANQTSSNYYALYPYDENAKIEGTTVTTTLRSTQTPRAGSFAKSHNPSVAMANGNQELYFRNTCALVKFTLNCGDNNVTKAVLRGNNGEKLSGSIKIDIAAADPTAQTVSENSSAEVTLDGELTTGNTYYFVVAPGTLSKGLTLILYNDKNEGYTRSGSNETKLTAGHILNLGTINATDFDASTSAKGVYHIFSADGLKAWAEQDDCLTSNVILENDIDMSGITWTPVANDISNGYAGDFNGNNKYINNLKVNGSGNIGLLGSLGAGAKVHDIKFSKADITGDDTSYSGTVAGTSLGIITNCSVSDSKVSGKFSGAITGSNSVQVNNCNAVNVEINSTYAAGGIAGSSYGKIEYCTVSGNSKITAYGSSTVAGGIVGSTSQESGISTSGRLLKCAVDGATVSGKWAGGIAGENSFGTVAQCVTNKITVTHATYESSTRLGGIVGYNTRGSVVASYSAYSTIGDESLVSEAMGGIVGYNYNNTAYVYGCYSTHVSLQHHTDGNESNIGSIAGYTNGHVTSCYAVLPDNTTGISLIGKGSTPEHCVESGNANYETLIDDVDDLKDDNGATWVAKEIWNITAGGYPTIAPEYLGHQPAY